MAPWTLALLGGAILAVAWLPLVLERLPVSLPMLAVAVGFVPASLFGAENFPFTHRQLVEDLTEFVLIVAVMEAGLAIDRPFSGRTWGGTWRLLGVAMPLSILGIAAFSHGVLGFPLGVAVLLGGILAPTDPVLASAVQVGPPGVGEEGEVRFALTSEAGLNDGLAFPFVLLGLTIIGAGGGMEGWVGHWLLVDLLWRVAGAVLIGFVLGWILIQGDRLLPEQYRLMQSRDELVAIGLTFLAYGVGELAHTYGFVAVFTTAVTLRSLGGSVSYARKLHAFAEQAERMAMVLVLAAFGGAIAAGLLNALTWLDGVFAVAVLFVIRPLATLTGFIRSTEPLAVRLALGFLGIRGLGSFFYMAYALNHGLPGEFGQRLWAVTGLVVLLSLIAYGVGAERIMRRLDKLCSQGASRSGRVSR
ncbi:MAG: cation:proton antiporter [Acetobacteraceae bacterium]|nr:cation:proton antiporter [Acetobacteraceae bacterium]